MKKDRRIDIADGCCWRITYVSTLLCLLFGFAVLYYSDRVPAAISLCVFPLVLACCGYSFFNLGLYGQKEMRIVLILIAWMSFCCALNIHNGDRFNSLSTFFTISTTILIGFFLPYFLAGEQRIRCYDFIAYLFLFVTTAFALIGVYVFFTGKSVIFPFTDLEANIGALDHRMNLFSVSTVTGGLAGLSVAISCFQLVKSRQWKGKLLFGLLAFIHDMILVMSDCRSAKLALLAVFFLLGYSFAVSCFKTKKRFLIGIIIGIASAAAIWFFNQAAVSALNARNAGASAAQSTMAVSISNKNLTNASTMNQRLNIWTEALKRMGSSPKSFIIGASPANATAQYLLKPYQHFHNGYVAALVYYGIPGLVLLAVLVIWWLIIAFKQSFVTFAAEKQSLVFLPAIPLYILVINLTEERLITRTFDFLYPLVLFLVIGFTFAREKERKANA